MSLCFPYIPSQCLLVSYYLWSDGKSIIFDSIIHHPWFFHHWNIIQYQCFLESSMYLFKIVSSISALFYPKLVQYGFLNGFVDKCWPHFFPSLSSIPYVESPCTCTKAVKSTPPPLAAICQIGLIHSPLFLPILALQLQCLVFTHVVFADLVSSLILFRKWYMLTSHCRWKHSAKSGWLHCTFWNLVSYNRLDITILSSSACNPSSFTNSLEYCDIFPVTLAFTSTLKPQIAPLISTTPKKSRTFTQGCLFFCASPTWKSCLISIPAAMVLPSAKCFKSY